MSRAGAKRHDGSAKMLALVMETHGTRHAVAADVKTAMNQTEVQESFEMSGRDEEDLIRRINHFRRALRAQRGAILNIKLENGLKKPETRASVLYQIPILES